MDLSQAQQGPSSTNKAMEQESATAEAAPRKEIYTYTAPWTVFATAWSRRYVLDKWFLLLHA
jgi:hypothetical protein